MKTFVTAGLCLALLAVGSIATADDLQPVPAPAGTTYAPPMPMTVPAAPMGVPASPIPEQIHYDVAPEPLFTNVRYVDRDEMHPCAIPKIIRVNDPCDCGRRGCDSCCGPKCVYIQICVPPCGCETVRCRRHGDRVRYDYGDYAVDVRVKRGFIVVDYQD